VRQPQSVPLATTLAELPQSSKRCDVLVWSSARDPQSHPCVCDPQGTTYPLLPFGGHVIVDKRR
jgi:hypothetical protein